jgi:hypothetical protein
VCVKDCHSKGGDDQQRNQSFQPAHRSIKLNLFLCEARGLTQSMKESTDNGEQMPLTPLPKLQISLVVLVQVCEAMNSK